MRHDKRDEDGTWRTRTSAESRAVKAKEATQTRDGEFTHSREPRRQDFAVVCYDAPLFKNKKVNRSGYHGALTGRDRY